MALSDFQSYPSVEAAERGERQQAELELRHAINNHADNLTHLNTHHARMDVDIAKLKDQMEAVLDSLNQINQRLEGLEKPRIIVTTATPNLKYAEAQESDDAEGQGHA